MIMVEIKGLSEAIQVVSRTVTGVDVAAQRAMYRCGALVHKTAVRYAPISPTRTMLKKLRKAGGVAGASIILRGTKRRPPREVVLTKWYADRLKELLSEDPRSTTRQHPGGLMRSIQFRATPQLAEIFVPANSEAGKYAKKIHDEKGITWRDRGPGTQAKGAQADDQYIVRAIRDKSPDIVRICEHEFGKLIPKG
jgi:hypothetical protein